MELLRRILVEILWLGLAAGVGIVAWIWLGDRPEFVEGDLLIEYFSETLRIEDFQIMAAAAAALIVAWLIFFLRTVLQVYRVWFTSILFMAISACLWWVLGLARQSQEIICTHIEDSAVYPLYSPPPGPLPECEFVQRIISLSLVILLIVASLTLLVTLTRLITGRARN